MEELISFPLPQEPPSAATSRPVSSAVAEDAHSCTVDAGQPLKAGNEPTPASADQEAVVLASGFQHVAAAEARDAPEDESIAPVGEDAPEAVVEEASPAEHDADPAVEGAQDAVVKDASPGTAEDGSPAFVRGNAHTPAVQGRPILDAQGGHALAADSEATPAAPSQKEVALPDVESTRGGKSCSSQSNTVSFGISDTPGKVVIGQIVPLPPKALGIAASGALVYLQSGSRSVAFAER